MNALAIVLARAGSKGLPGKNSRLLMGQPMVAWTLKHALQSRLPQHVWLSTDGDELASIAHAFNVKVVPRPDTLAHDTASVQDAARHALHHIEDELVTPFDHVAVLYGNVPVRPDDLTDRALSVLEQTGCDSVQSVCRVGKHHPYWMKQVEGDTDGGKLVAFIDNTIDRRQDLPAVYQLDGGIIACKAALLRDGTHAHPHGFLGTDRRAILTHEGDVIDIDAPLDAMVAEAVIRQHLHNGDA